MQLNESINTLVTLANAVELTVLVTQNVVGEEIADTIEGKPIDRSDISQIAISTFQSSLSNVIG